MIAVIADDLTGAAEIGGIGLQYGLKTEIDTRVDALCKADLLVINTDTRSVSQKEAIAITHQTVEALLELKPQFIYKKIDSALRGHVLAEVKVQMATQGLEQALIVPANPYLRRTIVKGQYYFKGAPIHLSSFATDPEFAITSSQVTDMIKANGEPIAIVSADKKLPGSGITVGEVADMEDLSKWAAHVNPGLVTVGAAGFFEALLKRRFTVTSAAQASVEFSTPALFVCGTTFHKSVFGIKNIKRQGGPVSYMPQSVCELATGTGTGYKYWAEDAAEHLAKHNKAIVAIDGGTITEDSSNAADLREKMALGVQQVFERADVKELLIEGGSTAAAVLKQLNISKLYPVQTLAPGVIRMGTDLHGQLHITLKPGSYDWPAEVWQF